MKPTCEQQRDFFAVCYLGAKGSLLERCISHAYWDMNRTMHGLGKIQDRSKADGIYAAAKELIQHRINFLAGQTALAAAPARFSQFDDWHTSACNELIGFYERELLGLTDTRMNYGQAQKWINMTTKYCWICWDGVPAGLQQWYPAAHIAVDEVILVAAVAEGVVPVRPCANWSRWNDQAQYLCFQEAVRSAATAADKSPLELEFSWWLKYLAQAI
jgi:hypothetical protein